MTLEERCKSRKFISSNRIAAYSGQEHDLYIALPDYSKLQSRFIILFDKEGMMVPEIRFCGHVYLLDSPPMRTEDNGYYCIQGKYKGSKGLHKIPLHRLAYIAFYGQPPAGYHIHHIDKNKHNNAANNLVALTETEHSQVHKRDVSIPRNLFTPNKPRGLIAGLKEEQSRAVKDVDDSSITDVEAALIQSRIQELLFSTYTEETVAELVNSVLAYSLNDTVLYEICKSFKEKALK